MQHVIIQREPGKMLSDFCHQAAYSFAEINFWDKKITYKVLFRAKADLVLYLRPSQYKEVIFVGDIDFLKVVTTQLEIKLPKPLNIPASIEKYAGRKITYGTIKDVTSYPVFIKPAEELKLFPGGVISHEPSLTIPELKPDTKLLISEVVNFVSEYRCFVLRGKIVGLKHYAGNFRYFIDPAVIENCIAEYTDAPCAYCIDFGLTGDGHTKLVEVNDFFACGTYGFTGQEYAYMLVSRWREIIKQQDPKKGSL